MKNVLITGGTGFLGKNLTPFLTGLGNKVTATGRNFDLSEWSSCVKLFGGDDKFTHIIHGAAYQGAGDFTLKYPADQFHLNNLIHTNTMKAWLMFQSQAKLIGIGSTCSYPNKPILSESDYMTGKLHESVDIYGLTKCVMQKGIEAYQRQYGLRGTTAVFATLYGPHDSFDPNKSHVVSALVKKFCDAEREGLSEVEVWGDGKQTRELIYVEDQITGLLALIDYGDEKQWLPDEVPPLVNVGTGIETQISDLAEKIATAAGYKGKITYNENRFVGVKNKVLDISLAKKLFGWTENYYLHPLDLGIRKTIKFYKEKNVHA